MQIKIGRNKKERNFCITLCIGILIAFLIFILFHDPNTWKEDVDGDGVDEVVKETHVPGGILIRSVIHEDGTVFVTEYNHKGEITHKWKLIPDPANEDEYIRYVWDEDTNQWLPDQNQDGIPDTP